MGDPLLIFIPLFPFPWTLSAETDNRKLWVSTDFIENRAKTDEMPPNREIRRTAMTVRHNILVRMSNLLDVANFYHFVTILSSRWFLYAIKSKSLNKRKIITRYLAQEDHLRHFPRINSFTIWLLYFSCSLATNLESLGKAKGFCNRGSRRKIWEYKLLQLIENIIVVSLITCNWCRNGIPKRYKSVEASTFSFQHIRLQL
jgi:hypothetical protein